MPGCPTLLVGSTGAFLTICGLPLVELQVHLQHFGGPFPSTMYHLKGPGTFPVLFSLWNTRSIGVGNLCGTWQSRLTHQTSSWVCQINLILTLRSWMSAHWWWGRHQCDRTSYCFYPSCSREPAIWPLSPIRVIGGKQHDRPKQSGVNAFVGHVCNQPHSVRCLLKCI